MTHFLGRLVERARGTAARVEPNLAPRFAAAPIVEIASESEGSSPARPPPVKEEMANPLPGPERRRDEPPPREKTIGPVEEAIEAEAQKLLVPSPPTVREIAPQPNRTSLRRDELPLVQSPVAPAIVRHGNGRAREKRPDPLAPATPSMRQLLSPNEFAPEPPIVRVTIGRIEVRATPAPAPAPRKAAPSPAPLLTLDGYAKAKKEGRR